MIDKTILIINGSYRKGNTYSLLLQIEVLLKRQGFRTEIVNLFDFKIESCIGCQKCVSAGKCCFADDMALLMKKMIESDGIILSSPVYIENISGKLKTFVDRTCEWYHVPRLAGKPVLYVATSAATGVKQTTRAFNSISISWGAPKVGVIARTSRNIKKPVDITELHSFLKILEDGKQLYSPSFYEINIFQVQKVMAQKSNGCDNEFWKSNDLYEKNYYYECNMNFLKRVFAGQVYKILNKAT